MSDLFNAERGALFSECRQYRWRIWNIWDTSLPYLHQCLLNPSIADEAAGDPTFDRGCERARRMALGGNVFTNAYAWISTDPRLLPLIADPVGRAENDNHIMAVATDPRCAMTICGWGKNADPRRARNILDMLRTAGIKPMALKINQDGSPQHPLYIGYSVQPIELEAGKP